MAVQDANGWTVQYLNWLAVIRDLEDCHDKSMSAPLREAEFKGILEAAYGHMLEIRLALASSLFQSVMHCTYFEYSKLFVDSP